MQAPDEVYACFEQLNLFNKKISKIRAIGLGYNLREDYLEDDYEDDDLNETGSSVSERTKQGLPNEKTIPRSVVIDEPIIIFFEDGERLEIDFSEGSSIRISKNSIPIDIKPGTNENNFDATQFFSCSIGQAIVGIEVKSTTQPPPFTGSYGMQLADLPEYIESVCLVLSNATKLEFEAWVDYGLVTATDEGGEPLEINLCALKRQLAEYAAIPIGGIREKP